VILFSRHAIKAGVMQIQSDSLPFSRRPARLDLVRDAVGPLAFLLVLVSLSPAALGQSMDDVPGVVVSHEPSPTWWDILTGNEVYISSPAIVVMPNGDYIMAHDLFGSGADADESGTTKVFYSSNKGATWTQKALLTGTERASLFVYDNDLYLFGYSKDDGNIIVRKSTNNGATWTSPVSSTTGLIRSGSYGGTPCSPVVYDNRIWIAQSNRVMSAPVGSDLLDAASWTRSNGITTQSSWLDGTFTFWTEGQVVASPETGVVVMPKIDGLPYTGLIQATSPGGVTFDGDTDFVSLPGAEKKFGAKYDPVSQKFYVLSNPVLPAHAGETTPQLTRTTGAVLSSRDLRHWDVEKLFLFTPHIDNGSWGEAFQYFNFDFDGDDMVIASRTAFDVGDPEPPRGHDSNLLTFHKIEDFREIEPEHYLVADTSHNQVLRYEVTQHEDAPLGKFTLGSTFGGAALSQPNGLAQDANGDVYIREQGGRILRFDALGNFVAVVASSPVPFQGTQLSITQPAYGERAWIATGSADWSDSTKWYYWGRPDTNYEIATFGSACGAASTVTMDESTTVKGLRFRNAAKYTLAGAGTLTLQADSGNGLIDVQQGGHDLQVSVKLGSHTNANAAATTQLRFKNKLDLNGKKLSITGQGLIYVDNQFVMHGGTLVFDGVSPLTFTSTSTPTLDGDIQFIPSGSLVFEGGRSYTLLQGMSFLGSERFDHVLLPDLSARYWDTSTGAGLQAGNGTWSTSQPQWSLASEGTSPLQAWSLTGLAWNSSNLYSTGKVSLENTPDYNIDACFNASGTSTVSVSSAVTAHSMIINGGGYTITSANAISKITLATGIITVNASSGAVNAILTGSAGLIKEGAGELTLGGTYGNDYTGTTYVNRGNVILNKTAASGVYAIPGNVILDSTNAYVGIFLQDNNNQLAPSSVVTFTGAANNSYFRLRGRSQTVAGISSDSAGAIIENTRSEAGYEGTVGVLTVNNSEDYSYTGAIRDHRSSTEGTGQLKLVKDGSGTLTFIGSNTGAYTGGLEVKNGTLDYSGGALPGLKYGNYCPYKISGGVLNTGALSQTIGTFQITGGAVDGTGTLTSNADYDVRGGTVNVRLAGSVGLTKSGSGTAVLGGSSSNTFTGTTTLTGGTLVLGKSNGVALPGNVVFDGPSVVQLGGANQIASSAVLSFANTDDWMTVKLLGNTLTVAGIQCDYPSGSFRAAVRNTDAETGCGNGALILDTPSGARYTFHGRFFDGTSGKLAITKRGSGTQRMIGSFTGGYTGGLRVENGLLDYSGVMPENCDYTVTGGTLDIRTNVRSIGTFQITGGAVDGTGRLTSNAMLDVQAGTVNVGLGGSLGLTKSGPGTAVLAGTTGNTYTGCTTLIGGELVLNKTAAAGVYAVPGNVVLDSTNAYVTILLQDNDNQLSPSSVVTFTGNAYNSYLRLRGHAQTVAGIASDSPYAIIENTRLETEYEGTVGVLTVNNSQDFSYTGWIRDHRTSTEGTGQIRLVKGGSGTLTISGENIKYTAGTAVNAGRLVLQNVTNASFLASAITNNATLEFNAATTNIDLVGTITGTGAVRKTGSNKLTLRSAANSYSGGTIVYEGVLAASSTALPGTVSILSGAAMAPGDVNMGGAVATGAAGWNSGGRYLFEINDADGAMGASWDLWNIAGNLTITPTFTISVTTLSGASAGAMADFDNGRSYSWLLAQTTGTISGFASLDLDTSGFQNELAPAGYLRLSQSADGKRLYLNYSIAVPGDANRDGSVNESDATIVAAHWGYAGDWAPGDFNNDGIVGPADAAIVTANWGYHADAESTDVPEPSMLVLLLGIGLAMACFRSARRRVRR